MPGQIEWADDNQSGLMIYPEDDDAANMGAMILLEP
jgi:hypothetical protein